tara:strand:- start:274 stop:909 length:636 start_codon:yes stop_codon:yes gene_type:complete
MKDKLNMSIEVNQLFLSLKENYKRMLDQFRPCKPGSEFLEQNLISLFVHEFLKQYPEGIAYTEIPFMIKGNEYWASRLDAFLATDNVGYLLEAKGSLSQSNLFESIHLDLDRIISPELHESFLKMAKGYKKDDERIYNLPNNVYGLVLADCWSKSTANEWKSKNFTETEYANLGRLNRQSIYVGNYGNSDYFILCGVTKQPVWINSIRMES